MTNDDELKQRFEELCKELNAPDAEFDIVDQAAAHALVASRKLTPSEADRLAELQNWRPLTVSPSGRRYDPMQRVHWTLPMVLHWIRHRTLGKEMSPEWRELAQQWEESPDGTWQIVQFPTLTVPRYYLLEQWMAGAKLGYLSTQANNKDEKKALMDSACLAQAATKAEIEKAEEQLIRACETGNLTISATEASTGSRVNLTSKDWPGMSISHESDMTDWLRRDGKKLWRDPFAAAADVMNIWPAAIEPPRPNHNEPHSRAPVAAGVQPSISPEAPKALDDLEAEYIARVRNWPSGSRPPSRADDEAAFAGRAKREVVRVWRAKHAPDAWTFSGRRRRS